jgi:hypothetical protein
MRTLLAVIVTASLVGTAAVDAQFRRGLLAESTEISLSPVVPPAMLLPSGSVELQVRNSSTAPARVVEQVRDMFTNQLRDNDARVRLVDTGGDIVVTATVTEWSEGRRNSQKYVSETRQIGTKQVVGKDGKTKTEPVYEYGRNKPSVVISGAAGIRVEVKRAAGATLADESARHTIQEEHLTESGPPARNVVEDTLIDHAVRKAAGRISPGREPVRVLLARSDDVDKFNTMAVSRSWQDWLTTLERLSPHRDPKRDAYRLHNLAVAHEALAYEAPPADGPGSRLDSASTLIAQAVKQNPSEKYIIESQARITRSASAYASLAALYQTAASAPATSGSLRQPAAPTPSQTRPTTPGTADPSAPMTNTDVMDLRALGLDDENLLAAIKSAKVVKFDLSPAGLKVLLNSNVSNRVIAAMRARAQ